VLKKLAAAVLALLLLGPMLGLVGIGVLMNPAAANCVTPGGGGHRRDGPGVADGHERER